MTFPEHCTAGVVSSFDPSENFDEILADWQLILLGYHQVSNIRHTKSQHLKDSRTVLGLSLPNPLKPGVNLRMKM